MRDSEYYRKQISHRAAVYIIVKIAKAILPYGTSSLYNSSFDNYDHSVRSMVEKILRWKKDSEELHELRKLLKGRG